MGGRVARHFVARERIAHWVHWVRPADGFPQTLEGPATGLYYLSDPLIRMYVADEGYDDLVQFTGILEVFDAGVTGTHPNETPDPLDASDLPSTVPGIFTKQSGAPAVYEIPSAAMVALTGMTHIRVSATVAAGDWPLGFDFPIIAELWANAWRRREVLNIGLRALGGPTTIDYDRTDMRIDADFTSALLSRRLSIL